MAKVKDIAMQIRGVSYHPEDLHDNLDEDSVVLLRANNIKDGKLILDDVVYVSKSKVAEQQYLQTGDILICASSGSKELVGKAAFVDSVKNPMTFGAFCKVVRPQPEYSEYLGHYFNSPVYRRKISALSAGANINNIKNEHIDNLDIQLVDEKERREIITILNELNMLISLRKQQLFKLDELVKARFVEMFGDEQAFNKEPLSQNVEEMFIGPFGSSLKNENFVSKENGYCMVYEQKHAIRKTMDVETRYIDKPKYEELKRFSIHGGDIIVSCRGTIGETYIVPLNAPLGIMHPSIMKIRVKDSIYNRVFFDFLLQEKLKQHEAQANGSGVKMAVTASALGKEEFIVPSIPFQNQFAAFVERVDQQKQTVQQSLEKLELMKKALMQEYFG